jgi:hypothetical protein
MTQPDQLIRGYVGEMLAAEKYLYELVKTQTETNAVVRHPETGPVLEPLRGMLERHVERLDSHLSVMGGATAEASVKGAASVLGGKIAGLFEKVRSETASRMLRDAYCALGLVTVSYTMLHSTALALHDRATADLALEHLNDLTPLVVDLSKVVPYVVVNELADTFDGADRTVGPQASNQTHEAWARVSGAAPVTTS